MTITGKSIIVGTLYQCENFFVYDEIMMHNPTWRTNMVGCFLVDILRNMYNLSITYIVEPPNTFYSNGTPVVDLYALPFALSPEVLKFGNPIQTVVHGRYGFLVRRPHDIELWNRYYTRPFSMALWEFLLAVGVVMCGLFFLAAWWEKRLLGGLVECNLGLELLLIIGGYCQHVPPVKAILCSRRTAYFTFFLYSYIIYAVYTSNLLSHLVSDKENDIGLDYLESGGFELAVLVNMKHFLSFEYTDHSVSAIYNRLSHAETMDIAPAIEAVKWNRTALLSDYITVYSRVRAAFTEAEICELIEVDLNSDVRKYLFASTRFKYKEKLKIGILKAKEAGLLTRFASIDDFRPLRCETVLHPEVKIEHIFVPLTILVATYGISFVVMLLERLHYKETKVWPYID